MPNLRPHHLKIALLQPQIAPNVGNIARACVTTGTALHLVRPLGFVLSDAKLRRSAMDYWPRLNLVLHDSTEDFLIAMKGAGGNPWIFSTKAGKSMWEARFADGDWLIFGSETSGVSDEIRAAHAERVIRIPQAPDERCLNLSTAAGIGLFEALRQIH